MYQALRALVDQSVEVLDGESRVRGKLREAHNIYWVSELIGRHTRITAGFEPHHVMAVRGNQICLEER